MCVSRMAKVRDTRPDLPWPVTKIFFALSIDERNSSYALSSIFSSTECISSKIICVVFLIPMELPPIFIFSLFLPYFNPDNRSTDPSIDSGCSVVHGERSSELTPKTCRTITTKSAFICVQKKIPLLLNYYQEILPCDILYFKQSYPSTDRISSHLFLLLYVPTYDKIFHLVYHKYIKHLSFYSLEKEL